MRTPTITIRWNKNEEGSVSYSREYKEAYPLLKADMLKDAIFELQDEYNKILDEGLSGKPNI